MTTSAPLAILPQPKRSEQQLRRFRDALMADGNRDRSRAYIDGLEGWLTSLRSKHTRRSYTYALLEFLDWYERQYQKIPLPHEVRRAEANLFTEWLASRDRARDPGVDAERLRKVERRLDLAIYKTLQQAPGIDIVKLREKLIAIPGAETTIIGGKTRLMIEREDPAYGLDKHLSCLVERHLLSRSPTIDDIRSYRVKVSFTLDHAIRLAAVVANKEGLDEASALKLAEGLSATPLSAEEAKRVGIDWRADPRWFRYSIETHTDAAPADRASTVVTRLSALSAFWGYLIRSGENYESYKATIASNVWLEPLRQFSPRAKEQKRRSRQRKGTDYETFTRMLATASSATLEDLRDRAAMLLFYWTALRAHELGNLRRSDVTWSSDPARPPMVRVVGKGSKVREFQIPEPAYDALVMLSAKLLELAEKAETKVSTSFPRARLLLQSNAPLLPALARWGCNAPARAARDAAEAEAIRADEPLTCLSPQAFSHILWRRSRMADEAEPERAAIDKARVHPHGLRHLSLRQAIRRGVPLTVVKEIAGHGSLSVTDVYTEEYDPARLSLAGPPAAEEHEAVAAPQPRPTVEPRAPRGFQQVIETSGEEVEEVTAEVAFVPPETAEDVVDAPLADTTPLGVPPPDVLGDEEEAEEEDNAVYVLPVAPPEPRAPRAPQGQGLVQLGAPGERPAMQRPQLLAYSRPEQKSHLIGKSRHTNDPLAHVYVGDVSNLVWWLGYTGRLKPFMPVMSYDQVEGTSADAAQIHDSISAIWERWAANEGGHGPTAAAALAQWLGVALDVTTNVDQVGTAKAVARQWMPFDAEIGDQSPSGHTYTEFDFRAHRPDKIIEWFEQNAWDSLRSKGQNIVDDFEEAAKMKPGWFLDPDPIRSLPDGEREELLAWIKEITGAEEPPETAGAVNEADIELAVFTLAQFSDLKTEKDTARTKNMAKALSVEARKMIARMTGDKDKTFDPAHYEQLRAGRATVARAGLGGGQIESNEDFWRAVVMLRLEQAGFAVGPKKDVLLGDDRMREMLRVDDAAGTIVHTPEFEKAFLDTVGGHSECVARRMARYLWEIKQGERPGKRMMTPGHRNALIAQVAALEYYLSACPHELEKELASRYAGRKPQDVLDPLFDIESLRMREFRDLAAARHDPNAINEFELTSERERHQAVATGYFSTETKRGQGEFKRNAQQLRGLLNPARLLFAAHRGRARR